MKKLIAVLALLASVSAHAVEIPETSSKAFTCAALMSVTAVNAAQIVERAGGDSTATYRKFAEQRDQLINLAISMRQDEYRARGYSIDMSAADVATAYASAEGMEKGFISMDMPKNITVYEYQQRTLDAAKQTYDRYNCASLAKKATSIPEYQAK
ncbi:hypothetical protein [Siccibacter colletis]|uniref:hypothetical protein n=1 Tax=Siccibacter colletis TaxID=1505757 RepID=UPI003CEB8527